MSKYCCGKDCQYYNYYYATTDKNRRSCLCEFCSYSNKAMFDGRTHTCELPNDVVLAGGIKPEDTVIKAGISTEELHDLMDKILNSLSGRTIILMPAKRDIKRLRALMTEWRDFRVFAGIDYENHDLWKRYKELLKFLKELEVLEKDRKELIDRYESSLFNRPSKWVKFKDLKIGDIFQWGSYKCVKLKEYDLEKPLHEQSANLVIIEGSWYERTSSYDIITPDAVVKLISEE